MKSLYRCRMCGNRGCKECIPFALKEIERLTEQLEILTAAPSAVYAPSETDALKAQVAANVYLVAKSRRLRSALQTVDDVLMTRMRNLKGQTLDLMLVSDLQGTVAMVRRTLAEES